MYVMQPSFLLQVYSSLNLQFEHVTSSLLPGTYGLPRRQFHLQ